MREPAKTFEDYRYDDISETKLHLQEVSKLLEACIRGILNPDY